MRISIGIEMIGDILLLVFFLLLVLGFSSSLFVNNSLHLDLIASIHTSNNQLNPIAAEMQAAGANTNNSLIMTEAKYTLRTA